MRRSIPETYSLSCLSALSLGALCSNPRSDLHNAPSSNWESITRRNSISDIQQESELSFYNLSHLQSEAALSSNPRSDLHKAPSSNWIGRGSMTRRNSTSGFRQESELSFHDLSHLQSEAAQDGRVSAALVQVAEFGPEIAFFLSEEIKVGKMLGKGSFAKVEEIQRIRLNSPSCSFVVARTSTTPAETTTENKEVDVGRNTEHCDNRMAWSKQKSENSETKETKLSSREFVANHCIRPSTGDARYAIKRIRSDLVEDQAKEQQFWSAAVDLALEARFLTCLEHPNIIKLRGVAAGNPLAQKGHYFLVLDRLYDTLAKRLVTWKSEQYSTLFLWKKMTKEGQSVWRDLLAERVSIAYDLSSAIAHMHKRRLCHRDIKPENVGFDVRGDVKIFDFGLARKLPPLGCAGQGDAVYRLTKTGSLRFMAPEVALGQPYNEFCDVYSFALLLWQMITCKRPFEQYTNENAFFQAVHYKHRRPRVWTKQKWWPRALAETVIKKGWHADWKQRPSMISIESSLCEELIALRKGDMLTDINKDLRRSSSVFRLSTTSGSHFDTEEFFP